MRFGRRPLVAHITTTDISLALLLGPQLQAFTRAGFEVVGISAPGPFVEDLEAAGIRHVALRHATRSRNLSRDVLAAGELYRLIRAIRPDVVHTHNPKPGVYGRLAAKAARVPVIVNTVHGLYATPEDRALKRTAVYALERLAASVSDAELVQNPEDLDVLRRLRIPGERLHLLGNGVDLGRFHPGTERALQAGARIRRDLGATDKTVLVLAVGRLVREKGYPELFEAAGRLAGDVVVVVAGPTEPGKADGLQPAEIAAAERHGVKILGHRSDVEDLYAAADIYVLASHREGFPRSAMEAAAMGLPIVATDIRGCRQVVDDGVTGLLVPARDSSALAGAITRLAGAPELRRSMGQAGIEKAVKDFDQQKVIALTLEVYRSLLPTP